MSKPKKLDLKLPDLIKITKALNENSLANKLKSKEKRIKTDKFLKDTFSINRKNFSFTIKDTPIKYNPSTFLYEIPNKYQSNTTVIAEKEVVATENEHLQNDSNTKELLNDLLKEEYPELKEMLNWYKIHKNNATTVINLDNPQLSGDIVSKSFKTYESILNKFIEFCKTKKQTQKDLLALALLELMEKYK